MKLLESWKVPLPSFFKDQDWATMRTVGEGGHMAESLCLFRAMKPLGLMGKWTFPICSFHVAKFCFGGALAFSPSTALEALKYARPFC